MKNKSKSKSKVRITRASIARSDLRQDIKRAKFALVYGGSNNGYKPLVTVGNPLAWDFAQMELNRLSGE